MIRKRNSLQEKNEESEVDKKSLRILQLIFQMNLNKFIKKNKDALDASIDIPTNKPSFTKE